MKCVRFFSFVLFALLGVFFGSFIINQNNEAFAVSDISVTYTSDTFVSSWTDIFPSCTGSCFHDFSYLVVQSSSSVYDGSPLYDLDPFRLYARLDGSHGLALSFSQVIPFQVYNLSFTDSTANYLQWGNSTNLHYDLTFILTNNPFPGITPSGSLSVTENGTYDVTDYAEVFVDIPATDCPPSSGGDYHNDLIAINNSILICAATCLVIYFFYCIYRMIIKNSGVK